MSRQIKALFMDVDGTLTDGGIYIGAQGEVMKEFHVRDGYAIRHILPQYGILPVIITGRNSKIVETRAKELNIAEFYQGAQDKKSILLSILEKCHINAAEAAYIGDDLPDIPCMELCGISACPADAVAAVKSRCDYVCQNTGGHGAVREFVEVLLSDCGSTD